MAAQPGGESRAELLDKATVEDITTLYTGGHIEHAEYKSMLREKAIRENDKAFGDQGYMMAVYKHVLKEAQKGWDNLKESAEDIEKFSETHKDVSQMQQFKDALMAQGQQMWGVFQILNAIPTAIGEVTGLQAERIALKMGASPGLASMIGIAGDVGTGIAPSIFAAKLTALGVKAGAKIGGTVKKGGEEVGAQLGLKLGGKATAETGAGLITPAAATAQKEVDLGEKLITKAITTGLSAEGVEAKAVAKIEQTLGKPVASTGAVQGPKALPTKPSYITTETGAIVDVNTGEIIPKHLMTPAMEAKAATAKAAEAFSQRAVAGKVAEAHGIPKEQVHELLTEWAPEHIAKGDIQAASAKFVEDVAKLTPEQATMFKSYAKGSAKPSRGSSIVTSETGTMVDITTGEVVPKFLYNITAEDQADFINAVATGKARDVASKIAERVGIDVDAVYKSLSGEQGAVTIGTLTAPIRNLPTIYRNLLLASPVGRIRDILSNVGATANYMAQRQVGVVVGGSGETTTRGTIAYAKGLTVSIGEGMAAFRSAFAPGGLTGTTRFGHQITGGTAVNTPTAFTVGIDRFFKTINMRAALYAQEMEDAIKAGRKFDINNVNFPGAPALEKALAHSDYITYQNDLGAIGKGLLQVASGASKYSGGISDLYFPFLKTPINLMKYAWNNTPGLQIISGRLWSEILQGGAAADAAMGRLVISNMFGFYVSEMVKNDMITGAGPADPEMRAAWLKTHEPYSIRVGDKWVPLNFGLPIAHSMGMIADYTYFMQDPHNPADAEKASLAILMSVHQNMGTNSWWDGFTKLSEAFNTKAQSDSAVMRGVNVAVAPWITLATGGQPGALLKQILDPNMREAQGVMEEWRAKMAGWSTLQPAKYDGYGDKIVPKAALMSRWGGGAVIPLKTKDTSQDPVHIEGDRLKVKFPFRSDNIGGSPHEIDMKEIRPGDKVGVGMTSDQIAERDQMYGNYLNDEELGLPGLLKNPRYQAAPDPVKREWFEGKAHDALSFANEAIQIKHTDLGIRVLQQDAARELPKAPSLEKQYQMQRNYANQISYLENLTPEQINNLLRFTTPTDASEEELE